MVSFWLINRLLSIGMSDLCVWLLLYVCCFMVFIPELTFIPLEHLSFCLDELRLDPCLSPFVVIPVMCHAILCLALHQIL